MELGCNTSISIDYHLWFQCCWLSNCYLNEIELKRRSITSIETQQHVFGKKPENIGKNILGKLMQTYTQTISKPSITTSYVPRILINRTQQGYFIITPYKLILHFFEPEGSPDLYSYTAVTLMLLQAKEARCTYTQSNEASCVNAYDLRPL